MEQNITKLSYDVSKYLMIIIISMQLLFIYSAHIWIVVVDTSCKDAHNTKTT